jgi:integrase
MASRPLTDNEVNQVYNNLHTPRNKALFILGIRTGFRISEILSIRVQDVVQFGKVSNSVTVTRANMKGKTNSRSVVLHLEVKQALEAMGVLQMNPNDKLFPVCRIQAGRILKEAVDKAEIAGKVSSHSMRKSYAQKMYEKLGKDLRKTQLATGHKSLNSLAHYLQASQEEVDRAILSD